jgi:hypothetical protein
MIPSQRVLREFRRCPQPPKPLAHQTARARITWRPDPGWSWAQTGLFGGLCPPLGTSLGWEASSGLRGCTGCQGGWTGV